MSTDNKNKITGFSADYRDLNNDESKKKIKKTENPISQQKDRMDNETEIDDFLPESEKLDDEDLLTKWDDETQPLEEPLPKKRGKHKYGVFLGSIVLILALTGVVFIVASIGTKIHSTLTDDSKLRAYDSFLTIVVAQDPKPFSSPDKADPNFVLNASLWKTMTDDGAANYTDYDNAGRTIVPLGDVSDACHELFGSDCELQPKNPKVETFFEYDAAAAKFHVALYSLDSTYVPYTESAKRNGDSMVLRVGYVPPNDETRTQSSSVSSATPKPIKHVEYVLKTDPKTNKEYIYAVNKLNE